MYNITYVPGVQYSDSQFLKVILHLKLLQNFGYIPYVVQYTLVVYFIPNSLFLLIPFPLTAPSPFPLPSGNC